MHCLFTATRDRFAEKPRSALTSWLAVSTTFHVSYTSRVLRSVHLERKPRMVQNLQSSRWEKRWSQWNRRKRRLHKFSPSWAFWERLTDKRIDFFVECSSIRIVFYYGYAMLCSMICVPWKPTSRTKPGNWSGMNLETIVFPAFLGGCDRGHHLALNLPHDPQSHQSTAICLFTRDMMVSTCL